MTVIIRIMRHTNGFYSVGKNPGGSNGSTVFKTLDEANEHARQLEIQAKGSGANDVKIETHILPLSDET
jgi:hypothetical protein